VGEAHTRVRHTLSIAASLTVPLRLVGWRAGTREQVRELNAAFAVSDRDRLALVAAIRATGTLELLERDRVCAYCSASLPPQATIRRRFCDGACRQANHRRRHRPARDGLLSR